MQKKLLAFGLLALVAIVIVRSGLNYAGYCLAEGRWLTDEEIFRKQIARIIQQDKIYLQLPKRGNVHYKAVKYKSVEEFLKQNPNCCKMHRFGPDGGVGISFRAKINGDYLDGMGIYYKARYLDKTGKIKELNRSVYPIVNNCGDLIREDFIEKYVHFRK